MNKYRPIQKYFIACMKFSLTQLVLMAMFAAWSYGIDVKGQEVLEKKISLSAQNQAIRKVLTEIEKKARIRFTYSSQLIDIGKIISIDVAETKVSDIIDQIFDADIVYEVNGKQIILKSQRERQSVGNQSLPDTPDVYEIRGRIVDNEGQALPGVNVVEKGTTNGTSTDANGNFVIVLADANATIIISFIGYMTQEINVQNETTLNITLQPDIQTLSEVVVVGYGTSRKIDLTGAVASVKGEDVAMQPNVNLVQALRGSIAGVLVTDNGRAGADGTINIRGYSSINGSNAPLIVLDGIPYSGGLSDINTNDIESMDILKDGSSAAIYGSRASNGVIMITTKKGKKGQPKLNYNGYYGVSDFAHIPKVLGPDQYIQLKQDASDFAGRDLTILNPLEEANFQAGKTVDPWQEIKQDAPMQSHELSISGQTDRITYYLSGSYVDQKSPLAGDQFSRLSSRLNLDIAVTDWLTVGTNTGLSIKDYSGIEAEYGYANMLSPYSEFYFEDGSPRRLPMNDGLAVNPLFNTLRNDNKDVRTNLFSNIYAEVKLPLPGLTYRIRNGNTLLQSEIFNYAPSYNREGFNTLGSGSKEHGRTFNLIVENILRYDKQIGGGHNIDVTLLYGFEDSKNNNSRLSANNIFNDALSYNGLGVGENQTVRTTAVESRAVSSMARIGYRFMEKYMLNATVRRDGFSAFGAGKKFGVFPSMGASWVVSNEGFMSAVTWLDLLKVRYSFGKNGNRGVDPYSSLSNVASVQYVFGDGGTPSTGLNPTSFPNPLLGWETTISSNLGVDFAFLKGRVNGAVDLYTRNTSDLLLQLSIPNVNGYNQFFTNIGKMNNKGIELTLNTVNIVKNSFQWSSSIVYTVNRNEILELDGKKDDIASSRFIGEPLFSHFNYVYDGIWQAEDDFSIDPNAKPGYLKFKDIDGDGRITPDDRQVIGTSQPDFTWGITNNVTYKGFMFSFFINGRVGGVSPNGVTNPGTNFYDRVNVLDLPYWTPANPLSDRASVGYPNPLGYGFFQKRDYARLQDVTLAYTIPTDVISKLKLQNVRVYVSGKNLKTWTDWSGYDPENGEARIYEPTSGPLIKSWVFGINIGL